VLQGGYDRAVDGLVIDDFIDRISISPKAHDCANRVADSRANSGALDGPRVLPMRRFPHNILGHDVAPIFDNIYAAPSL
jgi:hypothetical protein